MVNNNQRPDLPQVESTLAGVSADNTSRPFDIAATIEFQGTRQVGGKASATLPPNFGDYQLLNEIARGGMGVVYKAKHTKLDRIVALKMILAGRLSDDESIRRFQAEARAAANLDHPGIVPVYEVGEVDGQHFYTMGFVEGDSLWHVARTAPLEPREACRLIQAVAEAVQHAHDRGILHRDLKPQNILLTGDGQPRVTDFGLAKISSVDSSLTASGQVLGTPSFMPPEQAMGLVAELNVAADTYSLGATLYCLLTGRPPFQAGNPVETLRQVLECEPVSPRVLNPAIHKDLETICLKALRKSPVQRYPTSRALAEDLRNYLLGQPITAKPPSIWRRVSAWTMNHRILTASLATGISAAFLTLGALWGLPLLVKGVTISGAILAPSVVIVAIIVLLVWVIANSNDGSQAQRRLEAAYEDVEQTIVRLCSQLPAEQGVQRQLLYEFVRLFERAKQGHGLPATTYQQTDFAAARLASLLASIPEAAEKPSASKRPVDETRIAAKIAVHGQRSWPRPRHWNWRRIAILVVTLYLATPIALIVARVINGGREQDLVPISIVLFCSLCLPLAIGIAFATPPVFWLRRRLKNSDPRTRLEAVLTLKQLGPKAKAAAADLAELQRDVNSDVRLAAIEALAQVGADPGTARAVFERATKQPNLTEVAAGIRGLQDLKVAESAAISRGLAHRLGRFIRVMWHGDRAIRRRIFITLFLAFLRGCLVVAVPLSAILLVGRGLGEVLTPIPTSYRLHFYLLMLGIGGVAQIIALFTPLSRKINLFGLTQRHSQLLLGALMLVVSLGALASGQGQSGTSDPRLGLILCLGLGILIEACIPRLSIFEEVNSHSDSCQE